MNIKSTTGALPVAPSMETAIESVGIHPHDVLITTRTIYISLLCLGLGVAASFIAEALTSLIAFVTRLSYYGQVSIAPVSPADNHLGYWAVGVPVIGALIVGVMARYGSSAIRGHGIPEAMEQVLFNESKIPARITLLKPLSAAVAIGTGGPFGAEGPIIATGGALGSLIGQLLKTTASERKTLLAAGAAAGMTATFGSPISGVLLAIELLLFEFRPRSFVPVALAATVAACMRFSLRGSDAVFPMTQLAAPSLPALAVYLAEGAVIGLLSVAITKVVYWIEDMFEHLPIHWMWWPAVGALAVGVTGLISPHTLGVGYDNIENILAGNMAGPALLFFCAMKFVSWSIALGSGTSGGTLAPLFTIGGGLGATFGSLVVFVLPQAGVDLRVAALVGMAATFAGASRALLASIVFAFEVTRQPLGLVPLLGGCTASFMVSAFFMKHTIMTERISRRGRAVPVEYLADPMSQALVRDYATSKVVTLPSTQTLQSIRDQIASGDPRYHHQGFPIVDGGGKVLGVITRREIFDSARTPGQALVSLIQRPAVVVSPALSLRQAADLMMHERVGRLPVIEGGALIGILSRSDLLAVHRQTHRESRHLERSLRFWKL